MATGYVECTALCKSFKCDKQPPALKIIQKSGKKTIWCTWIDEECDGPWCKFSKCMERRMTDDGRCKPPIKKVEPAVRQADDFEYPDAIPKDIAKKLGKR
ncbi:MAG: hypothetical protein JW779_08395 [Candidatus Thorarchaeota archaeon]|nr:hypothetical protein [Candidatus Thorarchaeota archaeon]